MSDPISPADLRALVDEAEAFRIRDIADRLNVESAPIHEAVKALRDYATALEYGCVDRAQPKPTVVALPNTVVLLDGRLYLAESDVLAALRAAGCVVEGEAS